MLAKRHIRDNISIRCSVIHVVSTPLVDIYWVLETNLQPDRIHKLVEGRASAREELRYSHSFAAVNEGEYLTDENVS